jgi:ABC-type Fe3+/spermidine/putrescine transport system ATPase subunit
MREKIRKLQEQLHITTVFVTYDLFEAIAISDRLVIMRDGLIEQVGSPIKIYERQANEFIAGFVGYINFMNGRVTRSMRRRATPSSTGVWRIRDRAGAGRYPTERRRPHGRPAGERHPFARMRNQTEKRHLRDLEVLYVYRIAGEMHGSDREKKMIINQYNPLDAQRFQHADNAEVEIPRSIHLLKKEKGSSG